MKWLWLSFLIAVVDQTTKYIVIRSLDLYESLRVFAGFKITLVHNTGALFSFLSDAGGWQRWLLIAFSSVISCVLVVWLHNMPLHRRWLSCSLALVLGGAVGNLIDRILYGYVVDFFDVSLTFIPMSLFNPWPTFNIADSAVTIGVVMLIIDTFWFDNAVVSIPAGKPDRG